MTTKRNAVWATCGHCKWTWQVYAPLPSPMEVVATAMKNAECPNCTDEPPKLFMAREEDIRAAEQRFG